MTAYALEGVEASVSQTTDFQRDDFHEMIQSLADASTTAKERIGTMEHGKFKIVGFIPPDDSDSYGWRSPSQEKRGQKRKRKEDDGDESRAGSWRT